MWVGRPVDDWRPRWRRCIAGGSPTLARGNQGRIPDWHVWITHALSGHWTWWWHSSAAGAPPCTGGVTPRSLEMGVSKEITSLLLMNYRILQFLQKIPNPSPRLCYHVETKRRRVRGMNSLYFPLSHHIYIYKKVRLYIR